MTMKRFQITILLSFLSISCSSCSKDDHHNTGDSLLSKEYDAVIGVLAPDTAVHFTRGYPTEVFVGRLIPTDIHNIFAVEGMQDSVLWKLMVATRRWYVLYYEYDSTAQVSIQGINQNVQLTYVGKGIYRDVSQQLKVKSLETYTLTVNKQDGRVFSSTTTVPGNIKFDSLGHMSAERDTFRVTPDTQKVWYYDIKVSTVTEPSYCVLISRSDNFNFSVSAYVFKDELKNGVIFSDNTGGLPPPPISKVYVKVELRSINYNLSIFERPNQFSYSARFVIRLDSLDKLPIEQRSNIVSSLEDDDVAGVFGAYNATRKEYVVIDATAGAGKRRNISHSKK